MFTSFILAKVKAYLKHRETQLLSGRELDDLDLARFHDLHR